MTGHPRHAAAMGQKIASIFGRIKYSREINRDCPLGVRMYPLQNNLAILQGLRASRNRGTSGESPPTPTRLARQYPWRGRGEVLLLTSAISTFPHRILPGNGSGRSSNCPEFRTTLVANTRRARGYRVNSGPWFAHLYSNLAACARVDGPCVSGILRINAIDLSGVPN